MERNTQFRCGYFSAEITRMGFAAGGSGNRIVDSAWEFCAAVSIAAMVKVPEAAPVESLLADEVDAGPG